MVYPYSYWRATRHSVEQLHRSAGAQTHCFTVRNQRFLFDWDKTDPASAFVLSE